MLPVVAQGERSRRGRPPRVRRLGRLMVDIAPLRRSPEFARLWVGTSVAQIGAQVTVVAVGLHIYALTHSTLAVSLVALWALAPMIIAGLVGGVLSDRFDRKRVALVTSTAAWLSIGIMTACAFLDVTATWPYYALAAVNASSATVMGTARGAIVPRLLPTQLLPAAAALNGITMGLAVTVGPAVAGVLVATVGFAWTYALDVVLFTGAFVGIVTLPEIRPDRRERESVLASLRGTLTFLREAPNVRATFVFDLVAMTLGQPRVVFPAAGALVFGGEAITVGYLTAAFAAGALLSGLISGPLGRVRRQGLAVMLAVASFGVFTALFGAVLLITALVEGVGSPGDPRDVVTPALVLGGLALAGAGASDNVSAVFRTTILQAAVPDGVRGRMQGMFYVVVAGGPRLGDLVAGVLATVIALWAPALIGGIVIMAVMCIFARTYREFTRYDAREPVREQKGFR